MTTDNALPRADFWPYSLHAVALVLPFLLLSLGTSLDRTAGGGRSIDDYLDIVAGAPRVYLAGGMLMVAGMAGLVATAAALIRLSAGLRRPGLLRGGAILIGVWGVCGVGGVSLGFTAGWVGIDVRGDVGAQALNRVFEGINYSPWGMIGAGTGSAAFVLGILGVGIGLIVARDVPTWTGILVLAAPVFAFIGGPLGFPVLMGGGFAVAAIGLAGAIPALLRTPHLSAVELARANRGDVTVS